MARQTTDGHAVVGPGLVEVQEVAPQVGREARRLRGVLQAIGRLDVALGGQTLKMGPERMAVILAGVEFEGLSGELYEIDGEGFIKLAMSFERSSTWLAMS